MDTSPSKDGDTTTRRDAASALELEVPLLERLDALVLHDVARALQGGQDLVHALELALGLI